MTPHEDRELEAITAALTESDPWLASSLARMKPYRSGLAGAVVVLVGMLCGAVVGITTLAVGHGMHDGLLLAFGWSLTASSGPVTVLGVVLRDRFRRRRSGPAPGTRTGSRDREQA